MPIEGYCAFLHGLAATEKFPFNRLKQLTTRADGHDMRPREAVEPARVGSAVHFPTPPREDYVGAAEVTRQVRTAPKYRNEALAGAVEPKLQLIEAKCREPGVKLLNSHRVGKRTLNGLDVANFADRLVVSSDVRGARPIVDHYEAVS